MFTFFDFIFIQICNLYSEKDRMPETYAAGILTGIWVCIFFLTSETLILFGFDTSFNELEIWIFFILSFVFFAAKYLFKSKKIIKEGFQKLENRSLKMFGSFIFILILSAGIVMFINLILNYFSV